MRWLDMREILKKNKWITLLASIGVVYFYDLYRAAVDAHIAGIFICDYDRAAFKEDAE